MLGKDRVAWMTANADLAKKDAEALTRILREKYERPQGKSSGS
jgi:hypothetical protein